MAKFIVNTNKATGEITVEGSKKVTKVLDEALENLVENQGFSDEAANSILGSMVVAELAELADYEFDMELDTNDDDEVIIVNTYEADLESITQAIENTMEELVGLEIDKEDNEVPGIGED